MLLKSSWSPPISGTPMSVQKIDSAWLNTIAGYDGNANISFTGDGAIDIQVSNALLLKADTTLLCNDVGVEIKNTAYANVVRMGVVHTSADDVLWLNPNNQYVGGVCINGNTVQVSNVGQVSIGADPLPQQTLTVDGNVTITDNISASQIITNNVTSNTGFVTVSPGVINLNALHTFINVTVYDSAPGSFTVIGTTIYDEEMLQAMLNTRYFYITIDGHDGTTVYSDTRYNILTATEELFLDPTAHRFTFTYDSTDWFQSDTTATIVVRNEGCGMVVNPTSIDYNPTNADPSVFQQSVRMYNNDGFFAANTSWNANVMTQPRWEISGGNLMMKNHTSVRYMFAIDYNGSLILYKITVDSVTGAETSSVVNVFDAP